MILAISLFRASTSRCFLEMSCWYFLLFFLSLLTSIRESFSSACSLLISDILCARMDSASFLIDERTSLSLSSVDCTSLILEA